MSGNVVRRSGAWAGLARRAAGTSGIVVALLSTLGVALAAAQSVQSAPSVQYRSRDGVEYRSLADTGAIRRAEQSLAAAPDDAARIIALGTAQAGARQFREAIATFSRGIERRPNDAMLHRWRGHRYLSVREFDLAERDLRRALSLDSTNYGALFHLGIVRFVRGDFSGAADLFGRAQPRAPDGGELTGSTDWRWMSLMRAGRTDEARAMLARRPDSLAAPPGYAYARRLQLYRGELTPETMFSPADTADVQVATLAFGLGNWYLVRGDTTRALRQFERSVASGGWPGFGFILSEVELRRIRAASDPMRNDWGNLSRYRAANAALGVPKPGERRVVFMGNSITEGWAPLFTKQFPGKPYVGRGIGGQTTPQMLVRFRQDVVALRPAAVAILAGTNDIAGNTGPSTVEMIQDNLASMAELAAANRIRVVLCSVLPVFDYPWRPGLEPAPKIVALNAWMKRYAESKGFTYVDFHSAMADGRNGLRTELGGDGVHPNEAGYRVMAPLVESGIARALGGR